MSDIKIQRGYFREKNNDCNIKFRNWIINNNISNEDELFEIEKDIKTKVKLAKIKAWNDFLNPIKKSAIELSSLLKNVTQFSSNKPFLQKEIKKLDSFKEPIKKDVFSNLNDYQKELLGFKVWNGYGRIGNPTDTFLDIENHEIGELKI